MVKKTTTYRALTSNEAENSRAAYGDNTLSRQKGKSFIRRFFGNLNDPVIRILLCALVVNTVFSVKHGNWAESIGMALAVFLAAFISTVSEHSSQEAFRRLNEHDKNILCRVERDDIVHEIPISDVVKGDILLISSGETVAADGFIVDGAVSVDQSALTGESREVEKHPSLNDEKLDAESVCALLRGSRVLTGEGKIKVHAVGDSTFIGGISREIQMETRESPLRVRLSKLARQISLIGYAAAFFVALAYLFNCFIIDSSFEWDIIMLKLSNFPYLLSSLMSAFTLALTVIVMAVPEGLPMMIAVVLSSNLRRMMSDNVLVRKPVGIESAGSMNILFTDKTGTLTEGKFSVGRFILGDGHELSSVSELFSSSSSEFSEIFLLSCFYNTSSILSKKNAVGGNSADIALLQSVAGRKSPQTYEVVERMPFDSSKKYSYAKIKGRRSFELIKGASEQLLPRITHYFAKDGGVHELDKLKFQRRVGELTENGARVLLIAFKTSAEHGYILHSAVELKDKPRRESRSSVLELTGAGIQVVMITGDSKETAKSIAESCGIINEERQICLSSAELSALNDEEISTLLPRLAVVARALPSDKSRLVRISQKAGLVVGMTGDGVNDAPALRCADVGFAMGAGTQVAKEAGDIVILDNNLSSIAKAVLYGRTVFKSIRKFITLQLTMNLCACGISMIGPFIGIDAPVTVVQMLWINMIMDTLGGLAFAGEAPSARYMREKPKKRDEPILNGYMINSILIQGGFTLGLGVIFLKSASIVSHFRTRDGQICLLTAFFAFFIFSSVLNCFNARSDRLNLFCDLRRNKTFLFIMLAICMIQVVFIFVGGNVLRTVPLSIDEWKTTLLLSLCVVPADFLRKLILRLTSHKNGY